MRNQYRYFPHFERLERWGITVTCVGHTTTKPNSEFPSRIHPDGYYFEYAKGRRLSEYQLIYVDKGNGMVQLGSRRFDVYPGSIIVLMPNAWHRYRPQVATGWSTFWLGFKGEIIDRLFSTQYLGNKGEVLNMTSAPSFRIKLYELIDEFLTSNDKHLFSLCGRIPEIVSLLIEQTMKESDELPNAEKLVQAQRFIIDNYNRTIDFAALSDKLEMPYRTFRHRFTKETGQSPLQYQLRIRLKYAKNLLRSSEIPLTEIANLIGFKSLWHFSHFFSQNCKIAPIEYRKAHKFPLK